jgi:hypothetical protein
MFVYVVVVVVHFLVHLIEFSATFLFISNVFK